MMATLTEHPSSMPVNNKTNKSAKTFFLIKVQLTMQNCGNG